MFGREAVECGLRTPRSLPSMTTRVRNSQFVRILPLLSALVVPAFGCGDDLPKHPDGGQGGSNHEGGAGSGGGGQGGGSGGTGGGTGGQGGGGTGGAGAIDGGQGGT